MTTFSRISCQQAQQLMQDKTCQVVDIRDALSYRQAHVPQAEPLSNDNMSEFLQQADGLLPTLVFCYHGNSSQNAAQFLIGQDFTEVYSIDGGFEAWRIQYPTQISAGDNE